MAEASAKLGFAEAQRVYLKAALDAAPEEEINTSASTSDDEGGTPRDRSLRQTASLPRTQDAMNVALALSR
jgi:hypothetical protein